MNMNYDMICERTVPKRYGLMGHFRRAAIRTATGLFCLVLLGLLGTGRLQAQNAGPDPMSTVENGSPPFPDHDTIISITQKTWYNGALYQGSPYWGPSYIYLEQVTDNHGNPWTAGAPQESFGPVAYSTNANIKAALVKQNLPGTPSTWDQGDFNVPAPGEYSDEHQTLLPFDTGSQTFWYSFSQDFNQVEIPGAPYYLGTDHVQFYESYVNVQ